MKPEQPLSVPASCPQPPGAKKTAYAFAAGTLAMILVVQILFFHRIGRADWDQFLTLHLIQEWNHHFFGLEKQWNPLLGGGMSLAGDPQVPVFSLTMLLGYGLGSLAGIRLGVMAWAVLGFIGAYLFAGRFLREAPPRWLAAGLFVGNGFFITHLSNGHVCHLPAFGVPLWLWALHRSDEAVRGAAGWRRLIVAGWCGLALAPLVAISVDGSPIFPLYFFFWIVSYFVFFGVQERTAWPLVVLGLAVAAGLGLDAAYALPLYAYQSDFPRAHQAAFHNPLALPLFMLVPLQGTPGASLGFPDPAQEYSLYIGPVLAYLLYRYRDRLRELFPPGARRRFLYLSAIFFVLGMGSLRSSGVSWLVSPFDVLAFLPGFRSIKNTTRYWGFLMIPLSLLCAQAVWWFFCERRSFQRWTWLALLLFLFQFGFQAGALAQYLYGSEAFVLRSLAGLDFRTPERPEASGVTIVNLRGMTFRMASIITPMTGLLDGYQNMDYPRGAVEPGPFLVKEVRDGGTALGDPGRILRARWLGFSEIELTCPDPGLLIRGSAGRRLELTLNQNYYRHWSSDRGQAVRTAEGNLGLIVSRSDLAAGIILRYCDPASALGLAISRAALPVYLSLFVVFSGALLAVRSSRIKDATPAG